MENEKIDYNAGALRGMDYTDEEYVRDFDVPARLANTPAINNYMIDKVYYENVETYASEGDDMKLAKQKAGSIRADSLKGVEKMLAKRGLL
jgi:hypothetical protein